MTTALPTRPKYARELITYSDIEIAEMVEEGTATFFATAKGPFYVVKRPQGGSIKVAADQIVHVSEAHIKEAIDCSEARFDHEPEPTMAQIAATAKRFAMEDIDDNAAEAALADAELRDSAIQDYLVAAQELGTSVEEYTDGEYYVNNGRVFSAEERAKTTVASRAARLDALAAKWS